MVELALSVPFLMLLFISILFFGRYFLMAQTLLYAAQEGAKIAARTPNLSDPDIRTQVRGFTTGGGQSNAQSSVYAALAAANLLSSGRTGDLPPGAKVAILPWDGDGSAADNSVPAGTVQVRIDYPFALLASPFGTSTIANQNVGIAMTADGSGRPVQFGSFTITERATSAWEIYQNPN
ncbi:MAG: pilus assembly protein [Cyanobacteria bacterium SZAS LIN-2]|nr:pilus assembly protein [Cyanobacteria bacterium SZAS LIN-3]MBS1996862.1 pilus assembly protein [Cyanobacteria bacterium SZAS LIN-2]MBS2007290.1 pilus assembly protein [Cyanobacteria bacterium SZAS TMP-1]